MKPITLFLIVAFITFFLGSCADKDEKQQQLIEDLCGDGICQKAELKVNTCSEDCTSVLQQLEQQPQGDYQTQSPETQPLSTESSVSLNDDSDTTGNTGYSMETYEYLPVEQEAAWTSEITYSQKSQSEHAVNGVDLLISQYSVENPTTGAELETTVYAPKDASSTHKYPAIILIPGGISGKSTFEKIRHTSKESQVESVASAGFIVLIFSPDGREGSTGTEQYNGYDGQDGLYEEYRFLKEYEGVDETNIGFASFSYGVALVSGMLGRYQPDVKFYIEWEGPVNRQYVTVGCRGVGNVGSAIQEGISCNDEEYWQEREALRFVPYFPVNYFVILQSEDDHVQSTVQHSVDINNKAIKYLDWTRINGNENTINTEYTIDTLPVLTDEEINTELLDTLKEISEY